YVFRNTTDSPGVTFAVKLPAPAATYDDFVLTVDGTAPKLLFDKATVVASAPIAPGRSAALRLAYRSWGLNTWKYVFGNDAAAVRDFQLRMKTNFADIDFPDSSLSPTAERRAPRGWNLDWAYKNLVSGNTIALTMPDKLQPGPVAGRISFFAPVSLFFF